MATADKLTTVAENVPKVYHAGQMNIVENAECLKGSKSGSAMLIDDVSPVTHEMGVKVRGKNLFDINAAELINANIIDNGIQFTGSGGGAIDVLLPKGKYTISFKRSVETNFYLRNGKVDSGYISVISSTETSKTFTFNADVDGYLRIHSFKNGLILSDIQIELGTTATSYTPYVPDLTAVTVSRCGLNLWDEIYAQGHLSVSTGDIASTTSNTIRSVNFIPVKANTSYYIFSASGRLYFCFYDKDKNYLSYKAGQNESIVSPPNSAFCRFYRALNSGTDYSNDICLSFENHGYEAYKPLATYTPSADGTVNGVTSLYPNTTLMNDTDGVIIDCDYYKDIDKAFNELTSAIALSGGE